MDTVEKCTVILTKSMLHDRDISNLRNLTNLSNLSNLSTLSNLSKGDHARHLVASSSFDTLAISFVFSGLTDFP